MASTYSPNLRIQLIGGGEQANTWGYTTNVNLGTVIEDAIAGFEEITVAASNITLTKYDGIEDQARKAILKFSGTPAAPRTIKLPPDASKLYVVHNTCGQTLTIAVDGDPIPGAVATVPTASVYQVYTDGTNVYRVT